MTQEEKQLLLKDLCARLPYGVKLGFENSDLILVPNDFNIYTMQLSTNQIYPKYNSTVIGHRYDIWSYRPYLRPMSSMTDDEIDRMWEIYESGPAAESSVAVADYLYERHLDCHYLIEKGLALEATEGMYKQD